MAGSPRCRNWKLNHAGHGVRCIESNAKFLAEQALVSMLQGWKLQADAHEAQHGSKIAEDYFTGPQWLEIGKALRAMLNCEIGRLDGGTLDAFILSAIEAAGYSESDL